MNTQHIEPRIPKFDGTEEIEWGSVNKSFHSYLTEYYKEFGRPKITALPDSFNECQVKIKEWISGHSVLGNPNASAFDKAVILPIVNHTTGKLNKYAISSALAMVSKVEGIDVETTRKTINILKTLMIDNFSPVGTKDSLYPLEFPWTY